MADTAGAGARDASIRLDRKPRPSKVALIHGIVARDDAVSAAVLDTCRALGADDAFRVRLLCSGTDHPEIPGHIVRDLDELLFHPDYLDADVLIWHFGGSCELFNAVSIGNGRAPRIVSFHGVTPKAFAPRASWPAVERSLEQCHLLRDAEEVWAVGGINAEAARSFGVEPARIQELPPIVDGGTLGRPSDKARDRITILSVGSLVEARGTLELLSALDGLRGLGSVPLRLELVANVESSDPDYVKKVRSFIEAAGLGGIVTIHGSLDDASLARLHGEAHILAIPFHHESTGRQVLEALRAGCIPLGYAAGNLPVMANGLGRLVPTGDVARLEAALRDLVKSLPAALRDPGADRLRLDRGKLSLCSLEKEMAGQVERFAFDRISAEMRARVRQVSGAP